MFGYTVSFRGNVCKRVLDNDLHYHFVFLFIYDLIMFSVAKIM
jgi:hypothetical protein